MKDEPATLLQEIQQAYDLREKKQIEQAYEIAQKCLKSYPQHPEVHCLLGVLQLDTQKFLEAEKSLNTAITLQPDKAVFYFFLGQVLKAERRYYEAENAFLQCIKLNDQYEQAYYHLGNVYHHIGKFNDAIRSFQQAIKINPHSGYSHYSLAVIYHLQDKLLEAIKEYEKALESTPTDVTLLSNLGAALTKDKQYEKAIAYYQKAINLAPDYIPAITNLGGTYIELNQLDKASELIRRSLRLDPSLAQNWRNLALCTQYSSIENNDVTQINHLLQNPKLIEEDKAHLCFALGKIYDDSKEYDKAFEYYATGNEIKVKSSAFKSSVFKNHISRVIKYFDESMLHKFSFEKGNHPQPLIIVGTSRSGKSVLEKLLKQYPTIQARGEVGIAEHGAKVPMELLPKGNYPYWVQTLTFEQADAIKQAYLNRILRDTQLNDAYVMDTLPGNFLYLGLLRMMFPGAKFIHCTRNPLDTCLLMYFKYFIQGHGYTYQLHTLGAYYQQFNRMMNYWNSIFSDLIIEIKYENLVTDPKETLRKLMEFLGLDQSFVFNYSQLYTNEINLWRHYEKQLEPLKNALVAEIPTENEDRNDKKNQLVDLMGSAYQHYGQGDFIVSKMECESIIVEEPNHYPALHLLGMIYYQQSDYKNAINCFEKAVKIAPNIVQLHIDMANTYKMLGMQMQSEFHFKRAQIIQQEKKKISVALDADQRTQLLDAFRTKPEIVDEFESRLLLKGTLAQDLTTDSYMTRSWDQYFHDLSFGSYRTIQDEGKHAWRMRAWHFLYKNLFVIENILNNNKPIIRILDIGCSTGYFRRFLEGNINPKEKKVIYYWGLDIREDILSIAVKGVENIESGAKGNLVPSCFIIHDIKHGLPYKNNFFDYVVNFEMIKYLPIDQGKKLLAECYRVLNSQGQFFLSTTYTSNRPGFMESAPFEQVNQMLIQNGFQVVSHRGAQANFQRLSAHFKEHHIPLIKELLAVHPPEMVVAMITPLYPHVSEQVIFHCKLQEGYSPRDSYNVSISFKE